MRNINLLLSTIIILCLSILKIEAQTLDGIYTNGQVSLSLQENGDKISGLFIDVDNSEYNVTLGYEESGLYGYLGSLYAWIPYNTEKLTIYIAVSYDANNNPIWTDATVYELDYYSDLNGNTGDEYYEYDWSPIHRFGSDFYPSYVLATSTATNEIYYARDDVEFSFFGDANGYFGVSVSGFPVGTVIAVEVEGSPYIKPSSYQAVLSQSGTSEIYPVIEYDFNSLKNITQAEPLNVKYTIYADGEYLGYKMEVVWVRSVNDAVFWGQDHYGNEFNFEFIFAAYVNENDPSLDPILGQILDEGIVNSWIGYQGTVDNTLDQVFALWYHFQKKGFKYSSITTQSGSENMSAGQTVRFIKDAINTAQANCIDGTVLFASFLYKIGLNVSIVVVPGHAYLAFDGDGSGTEKYALETTMMGDVNIEKSANQTSTGINYQDIETSKNSFINALNTGTQNYFQDALPGIQQQLPRYMEINIKEARLNKVRPIK